MTTAKLDYSEVVYESKGHRILTSVEIDDTTGLYCTCTARTCNPCEVMAIALREARDAPVDPSDIHMLPFAREPKAAVSITRNKRATHIPVKFSLGFSSKAIRPVYVRLPYLMEDGDAAPIVGTFDTRFDGRWAVRGMLIGYLISRYRILRPCQGDYHSIYDFSTKDKRVKDPTQSDIILNTLFMEFTGRCMDCSVGAFTPES